MKLSLLRSEKGVASWVYVGAGGLLILILGIVFFASPNNTQTNEDSDLLVGGDIDINRPISPDVIPLAPNPVITDDGTRDLGNPPTGWAGFGDVPDFNAPPVGNFEVVDQGFNPLDVVERGSTPHLIVTTDGNPPVDSYLPITFRGYSGDSGVEVWMNTVDGPSSQACRGADGCSGNGPQLTEVLLPDGSVLLVQAVSRDERLLAQLVFRGQADSDMFDYVNNPDDALPGGITVIGGD